MKSKLQCTLLNPSKQQSCLRKTYNALRNTYHAQLRTAYLGPIVSFTKETLIKPK